MRDGHGKTLSVVIPTLGRSALCDALAALAAQEGSVRFAIVVVHGPEVSADAIRTVTPLTASPRLRTVAVAERSVGARRNAGVRATSTPWIAFTDDDCRVPPQWVADLERFSRSHPFVDVAGGAVSEPARRAPVYSFTRRINYMASARTMKHRLGGIPSLGGANLLVRRESFERLGGFDPGLSSTEDYEFLVRAHQAGMTIGTYLEHAPVEHWHQTDLCTFLRRYRSYGRGVAETVLRHGLDAAGHRLEVGIDSPVQRIRAALRFAHEDLRRHPPLTADMVWARCGVHGMLAVLRAFAWQQGALSVLRGEAGHGA